MTQHRTKCDAGYVLAPEWAQSYGRFPNDTECDAMAGSETWASGVWLVRAGSEDEFVTRWKAWLTWTSENATGFRSARLIRNEADGRRFESFSDWDDAESVAQWMGSDGFRERIGPVRELCEDVQTGTFRLAASFGT